MNSIDEQPQSQSRPTGIGPGERLQAARIQQGLSLEDVASRMHLSVSILEAIEENNFEEITAPIFVKGYLRAYARIVSLDEDEMIHQYLDFYSNEDPPIAAIGNTAPELSVADARIKWTTYAVVIVLAALIGAWWWSQRNAGDAPISLDAQAPTGGQRFESDAASSAAVASSAIEAVSESQAASLEPPQPTVDTSAPEIETEPVAIPEPEPIATTPEPEPVADAPTVEAPAPGDADEPEVAAAPATPSGARVGGVLQPQIAPGGSDRLVVVVHADSWADVKDASEYQLLYDLLRAEETVELIGTAPFSVFLGNGHGVEIRFNGEEINFASRIRDDNTARLKIGQ